MKLVLVLCLLAAAAAADDDKAQDKKTQSADTNSSSLTQPATSLLNSQVFSPTAAFPNVFTASDPTLQVAYTGYSGNVSPIQAVSPDFFAAAAPGVVSAPIPAFPVTRTVLPGTAAISAIQSAFPVSGNVFPGVTSGVSGIPTEIPGILGVAPSTPNTAGSNGVIRSVPTAAYRFLAPEAFTGGILPSLGNSVLQGQNIPAALQQILTGQGAGGSGIPTGSSISPNVFRPA